MPHASKVLRPPRAAATAGGPQYTRTAEETIDEDLHVKIFKTNSSSNWYVQFNHPSEGQRRKSLKTHNQKESRRRAWDIVGRLRSGEIGSTVQRGPKVKEVIEGFLADKRRTGRRESTLKEYQRALEQFGQFLSECSVVRLDQLTPTHLEKYEARLRTTGVAAWKDRKGAGARVKRNKSTSVHEKIKLVKSLTKWAVKMRKLRENPIAGYDLPTEGKGEAYCYTPAEVRAICEHAAPFFGEVFRFLALTGMRQGELMWLAKEDFDPGCRLVRIRSKASVEGQFEWQPKGDDRNVPLSAGAMAIAANMISSAKGRWLFSAPPGPGIVDDRLRASRLWAQLKKAKKAAGVKRGTLHSFRHFFVSTMANANVSPFKVMKIVGHRSLDIILTYYHVLEEELLDAVDGVDFTVVLDREGVTKKQADPKVVKF